jgi:hypothetical protein
MTNEYDWDPHSESYQEQENNYHDLQNRYEDFDRQIMSIRSKPNFNLTSFMNQISKSFNEAYIIATSNTSKRENSFNVEMLSKTWQIGIESARKTL